MSPTVLEGAILDKVIQGKAIAEKIRAQAGQMALQLQEAGVRLTLAVVRVGDNPASEIYVRNKVRACAEIGIESRHVHLPGDVPEAQLLEIVRNLNNDPEVDGILVQMPLPEHIDSDRVIDAIDSQKDVDGFHPVNLGLLLGRRALLEPCTPQGIMLLLGAIGVDPRGKHAVVIGRSVTVGRPVAQLLLRAHATVTICHRHTQNLRDYVSQADILVVAVGVPSLVKGEWIKEGATVIDVGINRLASGKIVGDVEFAEAIKRAGAISPVPGGVGPMTIAMLLWNTIIAGRFRRNIHTHQITNLTPTIGGPSSTSA